MISEPERPDIAIPDEALSARTACSESVRTAWITSGLSYSAFAARCGISVEQLARIERGEELPSWNLWRNIVSHGNGTASSITATSEPTNELTTQALLEAQAPVSPDDTSTLRRLVLEHLHEQGFELSGDTILAPVRDEKEHLRRLHALAVSNLREAARGALERREDRFVARMARGSEIDPSRIRPRLVSVKGHRNNDALLWRWCALHWSVPLSRGYGRRLRFLIVDEGHNNAVIGIIGLGDPVYALRSRDQWIGWSREQRATSIHHVMEAFALGAVPPYSTLCGGKLAALLTTSTEVRLAFRHEYGHRETLIGRRDPDAHLAMVTTHSALGRSSVYHRLRRRDGQLAFRPVGFTVGSGDFHITGEVYERLAAFAQRASSGSSGRHERWPGGTSFRNKREVLQRALSELGLNDRRLRHHGIKREVFVAPLAHNSAAWLCGTEPSLQWLNGGVGELGAWWRQRWAIPRASRLDHWRSFDPEAWTLYRQ